MKYLLDTHAVIWLLEGSPKLGKKAKQALAREANDSVAISDISLLEIALLHQRGVIVLSPEARIGLKAFAQHVSVLPINAEIAADAVGLPLPHRDPFDRVIVATAMAHKLVLVTKDNTIIAAKIVETLW